MTIKRLRAYATIMAITFWAIWIIDMSGPGPIDRFGKVKGTDFIHYYVIGTLVRERNLHQLYDVRAQSLRTQALAPNSNETLYLPVESPQSAILFAPLTRLPYTTAFFVWSLIIIATFAASCWAMWVDCAALRSHRYEVVAACVAFPGLFTVVLDGQTSVLGLAFVAAAVVWLRREASLRSGLALGLLIFKPHWAFAAGLVLLFIRQWRALVGLVLGAIAETAATFAVVGTSVMTEYWRTLRTLPTVTQLLEPRPVDSLKGYLEAFTSSQAVALSGYAVASLVTLYVAARIWNSDVAFEVRASALVIAMVLVSPHVNAYDLVLLAPVFLLMSAWLMNLTGSVQRPLLSWALCALFISPLLTGLPALVRLQFSVGAMAVILVVLFQASGVHDDPVQVRSLDSATLAM